MAHYKPTPWKIVEGSDGSWWVRSQGCPPNQRVVCRVWPSSRFDWDAWPTAQLIAAAPAMLARLRRAFLHLSRRHRWDTATLAVLHDLAIGINAADRFGHREAVSEPVIPIRSGPAGLKAAKDDVKNLLLWIETTPSDRAAENTVHPPWSGRPIADLGLSARALNALSRHGVRTIGGLVGMTTYDVRYRCAGIGDVLFYEIINTLASRGLMLKPEEKPDAWV